MPRSNFFADLKVYQNPVSTADHPQSRSRNVRSRSRLRNPKAEIVKCMFIHAILAMQHTYQSTGIAMAKMADDIRNYGRKRYVVPARNQKLRRFSIRAGDVVRDLKLYGRVPAVCSALGRSVFLKQNGLKLVESTGPSSGQSTTVTYTYEFVDSPDSAASSTDAWTELRGSLRRVFAELGGGEAYLRGERESFYANKENS